MPVISIHGSIPLFLRPGTRARRPDCIPSHCTRTSLSCKTLEKHSFVRWRGSAPGIYAGCRVTVIGEMFIYSTSGSILTSKFMAQYQAVMAVRCSFLVLQGSPASLVRIPTDYCVVYMVCFGFRNRCIDSPKPIRRMANHRFRPRVVFTKSSSLRGLGDHADPRPKVLRPSLMVPAGWSIASSQAPNSRWYAQVGFPGCRSSIRQEVVAVYQILQAHPLLQVVVLSLVFPAVIKVIPIPVPPRVAA